MKKALLLLVFAISSTSMAATTPSQFLQSVAGQVQKVLAGNGSASAKVGPLCDIMRQNIDLNSIAAVWLGKYANIASDQRGVSQFVQLMPSILMTRLMPALTGQVPSFGISDQSKFRGNGLYSVSASVTMGNGQSFRGNAVVQQTAAGGFLATDAEYFGFSGVHYISGDYQRMLSQAARQNPNQPVTQVVQNLMAAPDFVHCP